jgi:hypothetical protein
VEEAGEPDRLPGQVGTDGIGMRAALLLASRVRSGAGGGGAWLTHRLRSIDADPGGVDTDGEVVGLLALMLLIEARRTALSRVWPAATPT